MIKRNNMFMFIALVCAVIMEINLFACMTTFINDTNNRIAILNELDKAFMVIPKNGRRRFGNHNKHAHFVVYTIQKEKTQVWIPTYTCQQNECGSNGNVTLKFSDIEHCTDVTKLFTLNKHQPYTSMVNKLPMIQKRNCHCNCR